MSQTVVIVAPTFRQAKQEQKFHAGSRIATNLQGIAGLHRVHLIVKDPLRLSSEMRDYLLMLSRDSTLEYIE